MSQAGPEIQSPEFVGPISASRASFDLVNANALQLNGVAANPVPAPTRVNLAALGSAGTHGGRLIPVGTKLTGDILIPVGGVLKASMAFVVDATPTDPCFLFGSSGKTTNNGYYFQPASESYFGKFVAGSTAALGNATGNFESAPGIYVAQFNLYAFAASKNVVEARAIIPADAVMTQAYDTGFDLTTAGKQLWLSDQGDGATPELVVVEYSVLSDRLF